MLIQPVDHYGDLFGIYDPIPTHLAQQIVNTDWLNLPWRRQEGQETWARRRINEQSLPWIDQWHSHCKSLWPQLSAAIGTDCGSYTGTAWWLDEPGFVCPIHTDGEMPGAMQLSWHGSLPSLATTFYHYKYSQQVRYQFQMWPNRGYVMINRPDINGYRHLQWHGMLTPVPPNSFRLNSYSWIFP